MEMSKLHWLVSIFCVMILVSCSSEHEVPDLATEEAVVENAIEPRTLSTEIHPQAGEYFVYSYRKAKSQTGKASTDETTSVRIDILNVDESGITLQWHLLLEMPSDGDNSLNAQLIRASDVRMDVHIDPNWEEIEILNFEKVHEQTLRTMDIYAEIMAPTLPEDSREQTQAAIREMFEDRDFAYSVILKPVSLFLFPIGWEGIENQTRVMDSELPNPFNGPSLPSILEVTLAQGKRVTETEWIYSQRFASEQMSEYVVGFMNEMVTRLGIENTKADSSSWELDIQDKATAVIDSDLGFIQSMEFKRYFGMAIDGESQGNRVETWSWDLEEHGEVSPSSQQVDD